MDQAWVIAGTFVTAAFIVLTYSYFLWRDSPLYKIAEHAALGSALANITVTQLRYLYDSNLTPLVSKGEFLNIIPLVLGLLVFSRAGTRYGWMSRWPLAIVVGAGVGLSLRGIVETQFVAQLRFLMGLPLIGGRMTPIDNAVAIVSAVAVVSYFLFTREQKGVFRQVTMVGRYVMMLAFGAALGTGAIMRFSWLGGQLLKVLQVLGLA